MAADQDIKTLDNTVDRRAFLGTAAASVVGLPNVAVAQQESPAGGSSAARSEPVSEMIADFIIGFDLKNAPPLAIERSRTAFVDAIGTRQILSEWIGEVADDRGTDQSEIRRLRRTGHRQGGRGKTLCNAEHARQSDVARRFVAAAAEGMTVAAAACAAATSTSQDHSAASAAVSRPAGPASTVVRSGRSSMTISEMMEMIRKKTATAKM
jgi:hypothetical protein